MPPKRCLSYTGRQTGNLVLTWITSRRNPELKRRDISGLQMFWLPSDIKGNFHESPGKKQQERKHSLVFVVGPLKEDNNKEIKKKTLWETVPLQTTSKHTQMPKILLCSTTDILFSLYT